MQTHIVNDHSSFLKRAFWILLPLLSVVSSIFVMLCTLSQCKGCVECIAVWDTPVLQTLSFYMDMSLRTVQYIELCVMWDIYFINHLFIIISMFATHTYMPSKKSPWHNFHRLFFNPTNFMCQTSEIPHSQIVLTKVLAGKYDFTCIKTLLRLYQTG